MSKPGLKQQYLLSLLSILHRSSHETSGKAQAIYNITKHYHPNEISKLELEQKEKRDKREARAAQRIKALQDQKKIKKTAAPADDKQPSPNKQKPESKNFKNTSMNNDDIISEVKKAIALFLDQTFNEDDLAARLKQIIDENNAAGLLHKSRVEKLLFKVKTLNNLQRQYWGGDKSLLGTCKTHEKELNEFANRLLAQGYSIEGLENKTVQKNLFK